VGRGNDVADTGRVGVFGDTATTRAVSVATGAVLAALMVAEWVPSFSSVVCVPRVVWLAEVAAPVGSGRDAALMGTALWLLAIATGTDAAIAAWPKAGVFVAIVARDVLPVVCRADVAAPVGNGREAAETGSVGVLGETATTSAVSVATGAVEAALMVALCVPSFSSVVWVPIVV
jgi:hypothetical protein